MRWQVARMWSAGTSLPRRVSQPLLLAIVLQGGALPAQATGTVPPVRAIGRGALERSHEVQDSVPGHAVWALDPRTGAPLRVGVQRIDAAGVIDPEWQPDSTLTARASLSDEHRLSRTASGESFAVWAEERTDGVIRLQRFTSSGTADEGWPPRGAVVCSGAGSRYDPVVSADGVGGAYVAWTDYRTGRARIRVQHVDTNGDLVEGWPQEGTLVTEFDSPQSNARVVASEQEGVTIVWEDRRGGPSRLHAQRLLPSGEPAPAWPTSGLMLDSLGTASSAIQFETLPDVGLLVLWQRATLGAGIDLLAALIPDGHDWSSALASPSVLASGAEAFGDVAAALWGQEMATVLWSEWRESGASLRAQRLALSGLKPEWAVGGVTVREGEISRSRPFVVTPTDTTVAVAVQAFSSPEEADVFVYALDLGGSPAAGWSPAGVAACVARGDQHHPTLLVDDSGGLVASWQDARPSPGRIGASQAGAGGPAVELVSALAKPGRATIVWRATRWLDPPITAERRIGEGIWERISAPVADDSARIVLDDRTVPDGVHVQYRLALRTGRAELHSSVVELEIPLAPRELSLHGVRSLGRDQSLLVSFALPRGEAPRLDLLDVQGRRMFQQRFEGLEPGEHQLRWRLPNRVPSGVYFLRLLQGSAERTAKIPFIR